MSLSLSHTVKIGGVQTPTDFTSRVLGFNLTQSARPQRINGNSAIITLDNNDGALTPNAGGTYDSVDWFAQGVFIETTVNSGTAQGIFYGLIDDFELADNGTQSTVTITALDWVAVAGRLPPADLSGTSNYNGPGYAATDTLALAFGSSGSDLPYLGTSGTLYNRELVADDNGDVIVAVNMVGDQYVSDTIVNEIMPTDLCAMYGGKIYYSGAGFDSAVYQPITIGNKLTREATLSAVDTYNEFTFVGDTPTAGELPIADVVTGYNTEDLVNVVNSTRSGGTKQTATNTSSVSNYGSRTYETSNNAAYTDTDALNGATNIVNRRSTTRFTAQQLYFDSALLADTPAGSATQLEILLANNTALWQPATISYTPAGAASQISETVLIYGRQIRAIPGRTSFVLELLPAADYQSFKLDSSTLGVLDTNRLG